MRYLALGFALALAACGSGSQGDAAPTSSDRPGSPAPAKIDESAALLDEYADPQPKGCYAPRSDCTKLAGVDAFRRKLADAVARKDADAIAAMAVPEVKLGFGGDDGRARFLEKLKAADGELIEKIRRLLPLGCAATGEDSLTIPWYFAQDMGDIDSYSSVIVTGEDVPLYAAADGQSEVRQRLSWDIVSLTGGLYPEREFQQVEAPGGIKGHMPTAKLRSLLDYRLLANRDAGEWKITAILAGD